ncbi:MAG: hypothetical protein HXY20_08485 [Acidobacteria bacterium]|nr:hypothetical protein [Acidobacteriota bacterium]
MTFPFEFRDRAPVRFTFKSGKAGPPKAAIRTLTCQFEGESLRLTGPDGPMLRVRLLAPVRSSGAPRRVEVVESNAFFHWQRVHWPDPNWPRVIEVRADALGRVVVVAHLQRNLSGDGRVPDFGWEIETRASPATLRTGRSAVAVSGSIGRHFFQHGQSCALVFEGERWRIEHPTAALKRRGRVEVHTNAAGGLVYRYWRCTADERVPMQQAAWRRAEFVVSPADQAPLTATLETSHEVQCDWRLWDELYACGPPLNLSDQPVLAELVRYHHGAIVRSMAVGDDWGNVTSYTDSQEHGAAFGMNRLNHCPSILEEAWRTGDRRLREAALLWCDNFHDLTIWWGKPQRGGTRYNNVIAQGRTPPDDDRTYMWRSNDAVHFCTKGYDAFLLAYEETGDPRMWEAFTAQLAYAAEHVHALSETRNVGDVRDFVRLHRFTGQADHLEQALRLFRELRTRLSTGDLFDQGGERLESELPFIEEDTVGLRHGYAKPYIIGYALAGLPELARLAPDEPKLRDVVRAVADFLADSQDPVGGWRYPHPRSSRLLLANSMEQAWQLVQADRLLGPQESHLNAIERVLRQRLHGWRKTGKVFSSLTGWELATGKVKTNTELYALYAKPTDRDPARDYDEGRPELGTCPPEGLVYLPEVLAFYLKHRPAARLLAPPRADEPLGKVLARIPQSR